MMDENTPAFVLEVEIDDEISFKPLNKNKRPLQVLDSNTLPLSTPEKRKQLQKCHNRAFPPLVTVSGSLSSSPFSESDEVTTPVQQRQMNQTTPVAGPVVMYTDQMENDHKPKFSQAEMDSLRMEWQQELDVKMKEAEGSVRNEFETKLKYLEAQSDSLQLEKSIAEKQISDLQKAMLENRSDDNHHFEDQLRISTQQMKDTTNQMEEMQQRHEKEVENLKIANDKRISEMIKSHATSILAMQERVSLDLIETWQQKVKDEQDVASALRNSVQELSARIVSLGEENVQAIKETKKKMYDKVTQQFEAGNAKYEALKASYREAQEELQTSKSEISILNISLQTLKCQLQQSQQEAKDSANILKAAESGIIKILTSFSNESLDDFDLSQETTRLKFFETIEKELSSRSNKVDEASRQTTEFKSEICRLQETLLLTNKNLTDMNDEKNQLSTLLVSVKEEKENVQEELSSSKQEKDSQMLVIANMITEKGQLESDLEKLTQSNQELSQRCDDLRKMNAEVMSMLEKVYEGKANS